MCRKIIFAVIVSIMLFASMVFMNITDLCYSSSGKIKLYFDPQAVDIPAAKPDQRINFTVDVYVSNIEDVYAYQIVIKYNTTFLDIYDIEFPPGYIFEGLPVVELDKIIGPGYVIVGRTLLGVTSGVTVPAGEAKILVRLLCSIGMNGTTYLRIATVDKPVIREGLYEAYTYFIDSSLNKIDISSSNADIGICRVTAGLKAPPYAEFEVSPANPIVYRIAILNASKSFDPDGYIAYYYWNITHRDFYFIINTTDPVTYYNFTYPGTYNVTLSVVDNDNLTGTITYEVKVVCQVYYIRADGSIDPPDAPIISHDNITYYLTSNIKFCGGIIIQKNNITLNGKGFQIEGTGEWGTRGIKLSNRRNVTIKNIGISKFVTGILCWHSSNIKISSINITQCSNGIELRSSNNTNISRNNITNNGYGIWLSSSSNNSICGNNITNNGCGVWLSPSSNNSIFHNNFIDNIEQVFSFASNSWDDGYPFGGNYWSDYAGVDADGDGIGDTSYIIDENNVDRYPLMGPFNSFNTSVGYSVDVISNSTVEDFRYFKSNSTIIMHISNMTANQTAGFCRLTIPHELMQPPYTVKVNGTTVEYKTIYENSTEGISIIYFTYEHSRLEITVIPEIPLTTLLLASLILLTIPIIFAKKTLPKKNNKTPHFYS